MAHAKGKGEFSLGPLTVFFPDASLSDFWFCHDLMEILGTESNSDAHGLLERAIGRPARGIDIDHEADNVIVYARGAKAMAAVLVALDSVAVHRPLWSVDAFKAACIAMRAWRRPKPVVYDVGAMVAVPLYDGAFGATLVAAFSDAGSMRGFPLLLLLDLCSPSRAELAVLIEKGMGKPVGCRVIIDTEILSGDWPVVAKREIAGVDPTALLARERGSSASGDAAIRFIAAYTGLTAWDTAYDPREYELMLLPGVTAPPARKYLRDLLEARLVAAFGRVPDRMRQGPAVLHVHIAYPGEGMPRLIDLPKARQLRSLMEKTVPGVGTILTGGGGGCLDVVARTSDAAAGLRAIEEALSQLRLVKDTLVDVFPEVPLDSIAFAALGSGRTSAEPA